MRDPSEALRRWRDTGDREALGVLLESEIELLKRRLTHANRGAFASLTD